MKLRLSAIALLSTSFALSACVEDPKDSGDDTAGDESDGEEEDTTAGDDTTDGGTEAGTTDGGTTDAGTTDAGTTEEGTTDAGTTEEGTTTTGNVGECGSEAAPGGTLAVGSPFSHWEGMTHDGGTWDYCELAGTPFVLVISGAWCGPCNDLASGMAGLQTGFAGLEPVIAGLEGGTLGFVEVLLDNYNDFGAVAQADLESWEAAYPNENIHLLGDPTPGTDGGEPLWQYLAPVHNGGLPAGVLVDADFNLETMGLNESLAAAGSKYGG